MIALKKLRLTLGVIMLAGLLGGCASGARIENMEVAGQPAQRIAPTPLRKQLSVREVSGGNETNPLWKSSVGNPEFESALKNSLRATGLLAEGGAGQYTLGVQLDGLEQPAFGLDMTVNARVIYTVVEQSSGKTIWQQSLSTPYTARFGDSLLGVERLRLANEGAIRSNISQLIDELLRLKINQLTVQ